MSSMKPLSVYKYHVTVARDGYMITDEQGGDVEPTRRYATWTAAAARLTEILDEDAEAKRQEQQT